MKVAESACSEPGKDVWFGKENKWPNNWILLLNLFFASISVNLWRILSAAYCSIASTVLFKASTFIRSPNLLLFYNVSTACTTFHTSTIHGKPAQKTLQKIKMDRHSFCLIPVSAFA